MSITSYDHHPTLRHEERDALGTALQTVLIDLIDLSLAAKQLHWNVTGPTFRPLHLQLDELAETARGLSDDAAERARALGWSPDGRRQVVAPYSTLPALPDGVLDGSETIRCAVAALTAAIASVRHAMAVTSEYDPVTEDLLHQAALELEQHAWMFSAQQGH
jgi:starvation-inducible DNA-binding protein